jgi:hypothetical protein
MLREVTVFFKQTISECDYLTTGTELWDKLGSGIGSLRVSVILTKK